MPKSSTLVNGRHWSGTLPNRVNRCNLASRPEDSKLLSRDSQHHPDMRSLRVELLSNHRLRHRDRPSVKENWFAGALLARDLWPQMSDESWLGDQDFFDSRQFRRGRLRPWWSSSSHLQPCNRQRRLRKGSAMFHAEPFLYTIWASDAAHEINRLFLHFEIFGSGILEHSFEYARRIQSRTL